MEKILQTIKLVSSQSNLLAVYIVGLQDDSAYSDLDLVVVFQDVVEMHVLRTMKEVSDKIDIRKAVSRDAFVKNHKYWPYHRMTLLYGTELTQPGDCGETEKLIKMSAMFLTSFLRNYYVHLRGRVVNTSQLMKDLNDFNYCKYFLINIPVEIEDFIAEINIARDKHELSQTDARALVLKAIEYSWVLIDILDSALRVKYGLSNKICAFSLPNPTICIPECMSKCRSLSNILGSIARRCRLLYLPQGFGVFCGNDEYVRMYVETNYHLETGKIRYYVKKTVMLFVLFCYKLRSVILPS